MTLDPLVLVYILPLGLLWLTYLGRVWWIERRNRSTRADAVEAGLGEPASLHPHIDPARCLGCGACARACPEGNILGLVGGKAALLAPTECIGHGACRAACPVGAITLVFGTAARGVDIPHVGPDFQTNIPGVYIAGELGGMGLIRNAIEQGRQALDAIASNKGSGRSGDLDVVIVGGGPAGISASLAAVAHGLRYVTVEQASFGGTVAHFPRGKLVMTAPATLPIIGKVKFREISKEGLLAFWKKAAQKGGIRISYGEKLVDIKRTGNVLEARTDRQCYRTRAVLLAIGRRGTPRRLGVPGEDASKVIYRLDDPADYRGKRVLVVGGGDSAIEAAVAIAEEKGATVTLSYRGATIARCKQKNRAKLEVAQRDGRLTVLLASQVTAIHSQSVVLSLEGRQFELENDAVIVCVGGILPTAFLESVGIAVETKHGIA